MRSRNWPAMMGKVQVEVENLSGICVCWQRHQSVADCYEGCWPNESWELCIPASSRINQSQRCFLRTLIDPRRLPQPRR